MALSISNAIEGESFFKVTVGLDGTISLSNLTILQSLVAEDLSNFIGDRNVSTDLRTRIEACLILDRWFNRGGKGPIIKESVKDNSWTSNFKTSSPYMDNAISYLERFDKNDVDEFDLTEVIRDDAYLPTPPGEV